jgi:hypothetical protein
MLTAMSDFDFTSIDIDDERRRRAAAREGQGRPSEGVPIKAGGGVAATLPHEFPLGALAPLRDLDEEITIVLRAIMQAWRAGAANTGVTLDAASLIVDMLAVNPRLPTSLLDVLTRISVNVVGQEGFDRLMAANLSREDYGFMLGKVMGFYGLSLGESSVPSGTATEGTGEPSSLTSPASTTDSTPAVSGDTPTTPTSSEPGAS